MDDWTVAEAKAKFSEVVTRAIDSAPQTITRNGKSAVVVVSAVERQRRSERKGTFADFLKNSPLAKSGVEIERLKGRLREIDGQ